MLLSFRLQLLYVRGKRGRKVPVLLTEDLVQAFIALIDTRLAVGIHPQNRYVFAAPTRDSLSFLRGHDSMANITSRCGLQHPEAIRSTKVRKYTATVAQVLDLSGNELEWLANHMGHDLSIHKQYYRLQDHTLELAKISKLLLAIDKGSANLVGMKLDDISLQGMYSSIPYRPLFI